MAKKAVKSKKKTVSEAKITVRVGQETPPKADTGTPEVPEAPQEADTGETPETPTEAPETRKQYAFPKVNPCPRCHATDTVATSTQGQTQYRRCIRPICRETYKVIGTEIVFTDCKQDG